MSIADYRKAGKIASTVVGELKKVRPGMTLLEIAEKGESRIRELGGKPAFPINLSLNEIAAHYTPTPHDTITLGEQVIKIDLGVHVNGYIADTAFTLDFTGRNSEMVEAAEKALDEAIKMMVPGTNVRDIGQRIQETIESYNYRPISKDAVIFKFLEKRPVRSREAKQILDASETRFDSLPFAMRWIKMTPIKLRLALNQLVQANALCSYPILTEKGRGTVTQAEHTVIVGEKPEVTTRL